jgi:MFS family permease
VSLTGALSTDVIESGPFTSVEQAMLATELPDSERMRGFGRYNAVATAAGSLGALAAGAPALAHRWFGFAPAYQRYFLLFVPIAIAGAILAKTLGPAVEVAASARPTDGRSHSLGRSRSRVRRLCGLFAFDSLAGGFLISAFVAYWFSARFNTPIGAIGVIFFITGLLQTVSFLLAIRLARRFGLLQTMVFTHLPSNVLLICMAFSPTFGLAVTLWFLTMFLGEMDVPTRQAYVMALVDPGEQTGAAAYVNVARNVTHPLGPLLAGLAQSVALGFPFLLAGTIKATYDVVLWFWFRQVPLAAERPSPD